MSVAVCDDRGPIHAVAVQSAWWEKMRLSWMMLDGWQLFADWGSKHTNISMSWQIKCLLQTFCTALCVLMRIHDDRQADFWNPHAGFGLAGQCPSLAPSNMCTHDGSESQAVHHSAQSWTEGPGRCDDKRVIGIVYSVYGVHPRSASLFGTMMCHILESTACCFFHLSILASEIRVPGEGVMKHNSMQSQSDKLLATWLLHCKLPLRGDQFWTLATVAALTSTSLCPQIQEMSVAKLAAN